MTLPVTIKVELDDNYELEVDYQPMNPPQVKLEPPSPSPSPVKFDLSIVKKEFPSSEDEKPSLPIVKRDVEASVNTGRVVKSIVMSRRRPRKKRYNPPHTSRNPLWRFKPPMLQNQPHFSEVCMLERWQPPSQWHSSVDLTIENNEPGISLWRRNKLFKIGIWDKTPMPYNKIEMLKRALIKTILNDNNNSTIPRMYDCIHQQGWLEISCKDSVSRQWIFNAVRWLKPWPEAKFRAMNCDDVENYLVTTIIVNCSDAQNVHELVVLLKKQNLGLNADKWRIRYVFYEGPYLKVEFILTDSQVIELRRLDCKPTVGFGKAIVHFNI